MCILNSFCNIEVEEKGFIDTFEVDEMKKLKASIPASQPEIINGRVP